MLANFGIEKGITIYKNDSLAKLYWQNFNGSSPSNTFGENGDYAIDSTTGHFYKKDSSVWNKFGISADIEKTAAGFRMVAGYDYITALDISSFNGLTQTMDDSVSITFNAGDKVASFFDSKVYVASSSAWTLYSNQPSDNDIMFIQNVLNDPDKQKGVALFRFSTNPDTFTKIADFDFETAQSIKFLGYSKPASDSVTPINGAADTIQSSIEKIDTMLSNILSVIGVILTDSNLGTFTGNTVPNNSTVKNAIQSIVNKTRYENLVSNITNLQVIDSVSITDYKRVQWLVDIVSDSTSTDRYSTVINAYNDGGTNVYHSFSSIIQLGNDITGLTINVDLNAGNMRLTVSSTQAVTAKATRYLV